MVTLSSSPWAVEVADGGQRRDVLGAFDDGGSQPPNVVHGHVECLHQRAGVLAEALLARDQAVAVVFVLHLALGEIVGEADVVVGRQQQAGAFAFEPLGDRGDLFGGGFLLAEQMVETEHHERVGVGQDAFVDRELVAGLVDALEHRHRVPGGLSGEVLERQGGAVEEFQACRRCPAGSSPRRTRVSRRRATGRCGPRSWWRSGSPLRPDRVGLPRDSSTSSRC